MQSIVNRIELLLFYRKKLLFRRVRALIWKNGRLMRQKWVRCLLQILLPTFAVYFFTIKFHPGVMIGRTRMDFNSTVYERTNAEKFYEDARQECSGVLYYTPANSFTSSLIHQIEKNIGSIIPSKDEELLDRMSSDSGDNRCDHLGIIFDDVPDDGSIPKHLKYRFRMNGEPYRYLLLLDPGISYHRRSQHFDAETAIFGLQLAIDKSYIKMKANSNYTSDPSLFVGQYPAFSFIHSFWGEMYVTYFALLFFVSFSFVVCSAFDSIIKGKDYFDVEMLERLSGIDYCMECAACIISGLAIYPITVFFVSVVLTTPLCYQDVGLPVFASTDLSLIFTLILLYCINTIFFCFTVNAVGGRRLSFVVFILTSAVAVCEIEALPFFFKMLMLLTPFGPVYYAFSVLLHLESIAMGGKWSLIFDEDITPDGAIPLGYILVMFICQWLFYSLTMWGARSASLAKCSVIQLLCFPCKCLFQPSRNGYYANSENLIEDGGNACGKNIKVAIELLNVCKTFGRTKVIRNIDLRIPEGKMTVITGPKGCGKTTLLKMMAGVMSPSKGKIYCEGREKQLSDDIGVYFHLNSPYFPYLTVIEHLLYFSILKGQTYMEAIDTSFKLLTSLRIIDDRDSVVSKISKDAKQRLSLAIALIGKPKILILDDPISSMNVESSRQVIRDILVNMRGSKTIVFSTTNLEEVEPLGDYVAIMDGGEISTFDDIESLKEHLNVGYRIAIYKTPDVGAGISDVMDKYIENGVKALSTTNSKEVYGAPTESSSMFPAIFTDLEIFKKQSKITLIEVTHVTVERALRDEFLGTEFLGTEIKASEKPSNTEPAERKRFLESFIKWWQIQDPEYFTLWSQMRALYIKKKHFFYKNFRTFLKHVIIPILAVTYATIVLSSILTTIKPQSGIVDLSLSSYNDVKVVTFSSPDDTSFVEQYKNYVQEQSAKILPTGFLSMTQYASEMSKEELVNHPSNILGGLEVGEKMHTLFYNSYKPYAFHIMANSYTTTLLRNATASSTDVIKSSIEFVDKNDKPICVYNDAQFFVYLKWVIICLAMVPITEYFIILPHNERRTGMFHAQLMAGLSSYVYWSTMILIDIVCFSIVIGIMLMCVKYVDVTGLFSDNKDLKVLFIIFLLYLNSSLMYTYVLSYSEVFSEMYSIYHTGMVLIVPFVLVWFGRVHLMTSQMILPLVVRKVLDLLLLIPQCNLINAIAEFMSILVHNKQCMFCSDMTKVDCEASLTKYEYYMAPSVDTENGLYIPGLETSLLYFVASLALFSCLLFIINSNFLLRIWISLLDIIFGVNDSSQSDKQGDASKTAKAATNSENVMLKVSNLFTVYPTECGHVFVGEVSFELKRGECFGLLGANGSGKSTVLKMLAGDVVADYGDATIKGHSLTTNRSKYLSNVGYCPRENAYVEQFTGIEILKLFSQLRGLQTGSVRKLINEFGLQNLSDELYTSGMKRKLCVAMSFIGNPTVVLLDEPTYGADKVSASHLRNVIHARKHEHAIVIASNNLKECEMLCDRIAIMVDGQIVYIANVEELKEEYALQFIITIRFKRRYDDDKTALLLKRNMKILFKEYGLLKEERLDFLSYQIGGVLLKMYEIFSAMERLKQDNPEILDYTIRGIQLEEILSPYLQK